MVGGEVSLSGGGTPSYRTEAVVDGDPKIALTSAVETLSGVGFMTRQRRPDFAVLTGPGLNSTNQNPLLGASELELRTGFGQLSLTADLGGAKFLQRFIRWFPPLLITVLTVPWIVLVATGVLSTAALWPAFLAAGIQLPIWLVLGPWLGRRMQRRTKQALDTLIGNAALEG